MANRWRVGMGVFGLMLAASSGALGQTTSATTAELHLFAPHLHLSGDLTNEKDLDPRSSGTFWTSGLSLSGVFPIYGWLEDAPSRTDLFQLFGYAKLASSYVSFADTDRTILRESFGVVGMRYRMGGDLIVVSLGGGLTHDAAGAETLDGFGYGLGMYGFNIRPRTIIFAGAGYFYALEKGFPLPVLGLIHRFNQKWSLSTILPVSLRLAYQLSENLNLGLVARLDGLAAHITNGGDFAGQSPILMYRNVELRLGGELTYHITRRFQVKGEVGATSARYIKVTDGDQTLLDTESQPSAYAMLSLSYALSGSLLDLGN